MAQAARDMRHNGRFHLDDRGIRYCDIFPEIEKGDINVSYIEPGAAALWHRHQIQADYQIVVKGGLRLASAIYLIQIIIKLDIKTKLLN